MANRVRRRRRRRTCQRKLLDLPDDLLSRIFRFLNLCPELTSRDLKHLRAAFALAQTCTRLLDLFCKTPQELNAKLHPAEPLTRHFHPPQHACHTIAHLSALTRLLHNLRVLHVPPGHAAVIAALPDSLRLVELSYGNRPQGLHAPGAPTRFPGSLETLVIYDPAEATLAALADPRVNNCKLKEVRLYAVQVAYIDHLRTFYSHMALHVKQSYIGFSMAIELPQRKDDNDSILYFMEYLFSVLRVYLPDCSSLAFAVASDSRTDDGLTFANIKRPWPRSEDGENEYSSAAPKSAIIFFVDCELFESWIETARPLISPSIVFSAETCGTCFSFFGAGDRQVRFVTTLKLKTIYTAYPAPESLTLVMLMNLGDRAVIDKYTFCEEFREQTRAIVRAPTALKEVDAIFSFTDCDQRCEWADVTDPSPIYAAFEYVEDMISTINGLEELRISFQLAQLAPGREDAIARILASVPMLKKLHFAVPRDVGEPVGSIWVTCNFLRGLEIIIHFVAETNGEVESLQALDLGEMQWETEMREREGLIDRVEQGLTRLEDKREKFSAESIHAQLMFWRRSIDC